MVALLSGCSGPVEERGDNEATLSLISSVAVPETRVSAVWVLRTRDCFACPGIDQEYRSLAQVAHAHGLELPLAVLHIGNAADSTVVRSHLRAARIEGAIRNRTSRALRRDGVTPSAPDLWLLVDGIPVWRRSASFAAEANPEMLIVQHLAEGPLGTRDSEGDGSPVRDRGMGEAPSEAATQREDWKQGSVLWFPEADVAEHERFALVGRVGECLAAFRMSDASGSGQAWVVPPDAFAQPGVRVTIDSVFDPRTVMSDQWATEQEWRRVTPDEALRAFTGCLP